MQYWHIILIIRGYKRRNVLQYQLQRIQAWASMFCMGNPKGKKPEDILDLYFDHYKGQDSMPISQDDVDDLQELMKNNPTLESQKKEGV